MNKWVNEADQRDRTYERYWPFRSMDLLYICFVSVHQRTSGQFDTHGLIY